MEGKVILRGALSGFIAGIFAFVFAKIFAEPYIQDAIEYETGRNEAIQAIQKAQGLPVESEGPEAFSRTIQSTVGLATGIIGFATAMGALVAVVYLVLHGRFNVRPRILALNIAGFGFLGIYLVPFLKYPANPPAIGNDATIGTRAQLYLAMVACSVILLILAVVLARRLMPRFGLFNATLLGAGAFIVAISVVMAILPSLGHLAANVANENSIGFGKSFTETPLPVRDTDGTIAYPGFPADWLWKFRMYSLIAQVIVWGGIGLIFSHLVERLLIRESANRIAVPDAQAA